MKDKILDCIVRWIETPPYFTDVGNAVDRFKRVVYDIVEPLLYKMDGVSLFISGIGRKVKRPFNISWIRCKVWIWGEASLNDWQRAIWFFINPKAPWNDWAERRGEVKQYMSDKRKGGKGAGD